MTDFTLDGSKRFGENCADFLESVKDIDAEMAEILVANWDQILCVVREGNRDSKARTSFNEAIAVALDNLLSEETSAEDE